MNIFKIWYILWKIIFPWSDICQTQVVDKDYNMIVWILGTELYWLPLTSGCVELQLPASSSRVGNNREREPAAVLAPVSICFIVIILKPANYT